VPAVAAIETLSEPVLAAAVLDPLEVKYAKAMPAQARTATAVLVSVVARRVIRGISLRRVRRTSACFMIRSPRSPSR
jgi:hypothetical protein